MLFKVLSGTLTASRTIHNITLTPTPYTPDTEHGHNVHTDASFIFQEIFLGLVALFGLVGNALVCYTVIKRAQVKHSTWYYLCSLSVSDMFVCVVNVPILMYTTYDEDVINNNTILCQFNGFCLVCFFLVSVLTLAAISIHKFLHIRRPLQSRAFNKSLKMIMAIWVLSIGVAFAPLVGWSDYSHVHGHKQCIPAANTKTVLDYSYLAVLIFIGFFLPLVSMIYCYTFIFMETRSHQKRLKTNSIRGERRRGSGQRVGYSQDWGILKTVFVVVTTFVVCWTPFAVYICYNFTQDSLSPITLAQAAFIMAYTQSILNPVIYALRHDLFRSQFKSVICCAQYANVDIGPSDSYARSGSGTPAVGGSVFSVDAVNRGQTSNTKLVFYKRKESTLASPIPNYSSTSKTRPPRLDRATEQTPGVPSYDNEVFRWNIDE